MGGAERLRAPKETAMKRCVSAAAVVGATVLSAAAADQPGPPKQPPKLAGIYANRAQIIDTLAGQELKQLQTGREYVLRVETSGLSHLRNTNALYFGRFNAERLVGRLVEFRVDPTQPDYALIPVDPAVDTEWTFTLRDTPLHYDRGALELFVGYKRQGSSDERYFVSYYELEDPTPETAVVVNDSPPLAATSLSVGYLGDAKSDSDVQALLEDFEARFLFATKGYVSLTASYAGRASFPADGELFAGAVHDYLDWWNSLSHDLSGTSLLPLDPNDQQDLEMIKLAWYSETPNRPKLQDDADAALPGIQSLMLLEAPCWMSGAPALAYVGLYNCLPFRESKNNQWQYGVHQDFGWTAADPLQKTILHEFGHTRSLQHPATQYSPNQSSWTLLTRDLSYFADVMHQGDLDDHPTDRFYNDPDIAVLVESSSFSNATLDAPALPIPDVTPIGDPAVAGPWTLRGRKEAGAGLLVNGQALLPLGDAPPLFAVPITLSAGVNRFDVAQQQIVDGAVRDSHPNIVYTTALAPRTPLAATPQLQITDVDPVPNRPLARGERLTFYVEAEAAAGLADLTWWVERTDALGNHAIVLNMWNNRELYGSVQARHEYTVAFDLHGFYKVRAFVKDPLGSASSIAELSFSVGNPILIKPIFNWRTSSCAAAWNPSRRAALLGALSAGST
jgi:hypothetical protein